MKDDKDALLSLVVDDTNSIDTSQLAEFLRPYAVFDKNSKNISFMAGFHEIASNDSKIVVVLLASKARSLIFDEPDGLSPIEIINLEVMPEGSVKSSLKRLVDARKIKKDTNGKYVIPNYRINDVMGELTKNT